MKSKRIPRTVGWVTALAATLTLALYVDANSYTIAADLREHTKHYANDSRILPNGLATTEIAVDAFATPEFVVFGEPFGKGTVYTRATTIDNQVLYWAIDYHFVSENGKWRLSDSTMYRNDHDPGLVSRANAAISRERFAFISH
jgi:hypothetical protein